jgi:hypothetical protein
MRGSQAEQEPASAGNARAHTTVSDSDLGGGRLPVEQHVWIAQRQHLVCTPREHGAESVHKQRALGSYTASEKVPLPYRVGELARKQVSSMRFTFEES